ncbi:MAG: non-ribosomal peptide synthase/polyketide synthase, partial [Flavobacteriales bacterium]|nr:non-ribosomal peptide synthase/polyketide synthase [Flavobacteriales bacterium]
MSIKEFIKNLEERHFTLELQGEKLMLRAFSAKVSASEIESVKTNPAIINFIRQNRDEIINFLKEIEIPDLKIQERPEHIPLTFSQERVWFIDKLFGSTPYHIPILLEIKGELKIRALESTFKQIIKKHEVLRTVYYEIDGKVYQKSISADGWQLDLERAYSDHTLAKEVDEIISKKIQTPFDLEKDFMIRSGLIKRSEGDFLLYIIIHHISFDGWSGSIFIDELVENYESNLNGKLTITKTDGLQYSDFAIWQRKYFNESVLEDKLGYWKERLKGIIPVEIPSDFIRPAQQTFNGNEVKITLDSKIYKELKSFCQTNRVTIFSTLISGLGILLKTYTGQDDISIGTPLAGRRDSEIEKLIGFFVNTLVIRNSVQSSDTALNFVKNTHQNVLEDFEHQDVPFEKIVELFGSQGDLSRNPVFQVMFVLQNTPESKAKKVSGLKISRRKGVKFKTPFDLTCIANETSGKLYLNFQYNHDLYKRSSIIRLLDHYQEIIKKVVRSPDLKIYNVSRSKPENELFVLKEFSFSKPLKPVTGDIVSRFEEVVNTYENHNALVYEDRFVTYGKLNEDSSNLSRYLISNGLKPGSNVVVIMERGVETVIALFAILKAGGVYVPVDISYPVERIKYILTDVNSGMIMVGSEFKKNNYPAFKNNFIDYHNGVGKGEKLKDQIQLPAVSPESVAYVIYTSGSTGQPKGVMVEHRGVVNLVSSQIHHLNLVPGLKSLQFSSYGFDASCFEIFNTLLSGGCLVIAGQNARNNTQDFIDLVNKNNVELATLPPAFVNMIREEEFGLKTIVSAGESLSPELANQILRKGIRLINAYGPTESTVCASLKIQSLNQEKVTIGKPISNTSIYILDPLGNPQPIGVPGELFIGGPQVARGYLNREDLTKERFLKDPFSEKKGARMYKTGDLGRWTEEGEIEYLGRIDDQVKIRGYRIELGEIESALEKTGRITASVVLAKKDQTGTNRLVGYVVKKKGSTKENIQKALEKLLPEYMIPQWWVELESIPLTPNGKVDKKALPEVDVEGQRSGSYVKAETPTQEALVKIWEDLLEVEKIGIEDNFFELGGHSLLAMRVIASIRRELKTELGVRDLFTHSTIKGLSSYIETLGDQTLLPPIQKTKRPKRIPLSYSQERLWFIDKLEGSVQYHIPSVLNLRGTLEVEKLVLSIQGVLQRHESLRTVIVEDGGQGYQQILPWEGWQLSRSKASNTKEGIGAQISREISRPFDLSKDYMLRCLLIEHSKDHHRLVVTLHHISSDGWSSSILVKEVAEMYNSLCEGREAELAPLEVQYSDYSIWQRKYVSGEVLEKKLRYWREQLKGVAPLELPTDKLRPKLQGTTGKSERFELDQQTTAGLRKLSTQTGSTMFMTLLSAFTVLLHKYTNSQQDICVGTPIAGRQHKETEDLIGFFINTLAIRTQVDKQKSFKELLEGVRKTTMEAYEHQEVPFEKVIDAVVKDRDLSRSPLFQVMFVYQNTPEVPELKLGGLKLTRESSPYQATKFDLTLSVLENADTLKLVVQYKTDLFYSSTIQRLTSHFSHLAKRLVENPHASIASLSLLSPEEQKQIESFNQTEVQYPKDKTIVELFEHRVKKTPNQTALVYEGKTMSYQELNRRSNRLAHYLIKHGVTQDTLVPLCMERSMEMIVAMLGILKSGGAYVPIDPEYPQQRLDYMLKDTGSGILLGTAQTALLQRAKAIKFVDVQEVLESSYSEEDLSEKPSPGGLMYVIYTSGSTGHPKGVMITHESLLDHCYGLIDSAGLKGCRSYALFSPLVFDAGHAVIFSSLIQGGQLHVLSAQQLGSPPELGRYIKSRGIDCIKIVPTLWTFYSDSGVNLLPEQVLIFGGESLTTGVLKRLGSYGGRVYNHYGPTEATIGKSIHTIDPDRNYSTIPIGKPFSNSRFYVKDPGGMEVPIGVPGELYIGGKGLAEGYLNLPELTKEKFIQTPQGRQYRTGDVVRWTQEGEIEYLGRIDDQVKIRGYRIELGEIESALEKTGRITASVVLAKKDPTGTNRLVGYVVKKKGSTKENIQKALEKLLPEYMIPQWWVELESIPLTPNGKVDKKALPEVDVEGQKSGSYVKAETPTQEALVKIWEDLLGVEKIGIEDNFFELGGHSLLAMKMVSKIKLEFNIEVSLRDLFQNITIKRLSDFISKSEEIKLPEIIHYKTDTNEFPLTFSQERIWFIDKMEGSLQFHLPKIITIKGNINIKAVDESLRIIFHRHDILRTTYKQLNNGDVRQVVHEKIEFPIEIFDSIAEGKTKNEIDYLINNAVFKPFDLSKDAPIRVSMISVSEQFHYIVLVVHHIATDAWSLTHLIKEFNLVYESALKNKKYELPNIELQYRDFALWQRKNFTEEFLKGKLDYWKQKLFGLTILDLPYDFARPPIRTMKGASTGILLERNFVSSLKKFSTNNQITLYTHLLAAFNVLLAKYSGQMDICVGASVANRPSEKLEGLIGFFVNTLTFRNFVDFKVSYNELLSQTNNTVVEAYDNQQVPFEKVVDTVVLDRDPSRSPLFQVMLIYTDIPETEVLNIGESGISQSGFSTNISKFDLSVHIRVTNKGLRLSAEYSTDLFKAETISRMLEHYRTILERVTEDPKQEIGAISMLSDQEQELLSDSWNRSVVEVAQGSTIVSSFSRQAVERSKEPAVVFEDRTLSYGDLDAWSTKLARGLRDSGVRRGSLVGLYLDRGIEMLVGMLGILKAGGAYVPIDLEFPSGRVRSMLGDSGAEVLVSKSLDHPMEGIRVIDPSEVDRYSATPLPEVPEGSDLGYVIYTSGTTGEPKGVKITHDQVMDYVSGLEDKISISKNKSYALVSSIATDLGNTVVYGSLLSGGTLHVMSKTRSSDSVYLREYFTRQGIDCLKIVPSHWEALSEGEEMLLPKSQLIFGGEALSGRIVERIYGLSGSCEVINHYGPTETTIGKLLYRVPREGAYPRTVPIGAPFGNTVVYVLSESKTLSGIGVPGELYIGGRGVSSGYLNKEELTREKFIKDPIGGNGLLYSTGDRVRYTEEGVIEFLGRTDDQVKIRGYRIEPQEIERQIERTAEVQQVSVQVREDSQGIKILVAYVIPLSGYDRTRMLDRLRAQLPEYMVPGRVVELDSFPMLASGKIDRKKLPAPEAEKSLQQTLPKTQEEQRMAGIWEEVLEVEGIHMEDDFFALGGHSLLAIRLISAIRKEFKTEIPIGDVFDYPTMSGLMTRLSGEEELLPPIQKTKRPKRIPLSYSQERLWFIDKLEGSVQYHIPSVLNLRGTLEVEKLVLSIQGVLQRHESLRTVIVEDGGQGYQQILPWEGWQLSRSKASNTKEGIGAQISREISRPFDLSKDYMLRCLLIEHSKDHHRLVVTLHHISSDGWSSSILVKEVAEMYNSLCEGREAELAPLEVQYSDYSIWQRKYVSGEVLEKKLRYWREQLKGVAPLELPTDKLRPKLQGTTGKSERFELDQQTTAGLRKLSTQTGSTMFMTLLSAFTVLLHKYTNSQQDICVGTPIAGRQHKETEDLIGFFINTLAIRTQVDKQKSFKELLEGVRKTTMEAYEHQEVPFEKVIDAVVKDRDLSRSPLFQVFFVYLNTPEKKISKFGNLQLKRESSNFVSTKYDLTLSVIEHSSGLSLNFQYKQELFESNTIKRWVTHFDRLLKIISIDPYQSIVQMQILNDEELRSLRKFGTSRLKYPSGKTIAEHFRETARKFAGSIALSYKGQMLTYSELDQLSDNLALHLIKAGVNKRSLVPLCLNRSKELIISIIAILKAGGAYVPLDPSYPDERIKFILEDTGAEIIITNLDKPCFKIYKSVDPFKIGKISEKPEKLLELDVRSSDPAYAIYTSGSSGRPKGVLVNQEALADHCFGLIKSAGLEECKSFAFFSPLVFDAGHAMVYSSMFLGSCLHVLPEELILNADALSKYTEENKIDCFKIVPSLWLSYARTNQKVLPQKVFIFGGEPFDPEIAEHLLQFEFHGKTYNHYGPTEATIGKTIYKVQLNKDYKNIPIGKPFSNTKLYVLDKDMALMPIGIPGELYIGGTGLAESYLNQEDLTNKVFIPDPFESGSRIYKTGDKVKWDEEGNLIYNGRIDNQVKIRGYRVELGEIEWTIRKSEMVKDVKVLLRDDQNNIKHLVAYYIDTKDTAIEDLKFYLSKYLPDYLIPAFWIGIEDFPLTVNGKIDLKALPSIHYESTGHFEALPENEIEIKLAEIWKSLLKKNTLSVKDNFFELGGDSILIIQIVSRAKQVGIDLEVADIFKHQSIRSLADYLQNTKNERAIKIQAEQGLLKGSFGLMPVQRWYLEKNNPKLNQGFLFKVRKTIQIDAWKKIHEILIKHHDALRLKFIHKKDQWQQEYIQEVPDLFVEKINKNNTLEKILAKHESKINFLNGDVFRFVIIQTADNERYNRLFLLAHHLCIDAVSWRIIIQDIEHLIKISDELNVPELGPKTHSYRQWQQVLSNYAGKEDFKKEIEYWAQIEKNYLPLSFKGFNEQVTLDTQNAISEVKVKVSSQITEQLLSNVPSVYKSKIMDVLVSSLAFVLSENSEEHKVNIGFEAHGRERINEEIDLSRTVGWFTTHYPLSLDLNGLDNQDLIKYVKEEIRNVPNQGIGYGISAFLLKDSSIENKEPWDVVLNYLGQVDKTTVQKGELHSSNELKSLKTQFVNKPNHKIWINAAIRKNELVFRWSFVKSKYSEKVIEKLAKENINKLTQLVEYSLEYHQKNGTSYTPSDFGLNNKISISEFNNFLKLEKPSGIIKDLIEDIYPLSGLQEGLLFHSLYNNNAGSYVEQLNCDIRDLDIAVFQKSWDHILDSFSILRTGFFTKIFSDSFQVVYKKVSLPIYKEDLSQLNQEDQETFISDYLNKDIEKGFDMSLAPLMRISLFDLGSGLTRMTLTSHHILLDGWSFQILMESFLKAYDHYSENTYPLTKDSDNFRDYVDFIVGKEVKDSEQHWKKYLKEIEKPSLLPFVNESHNRNMGLGNYNSVKRSIDKEITKRIQNFVSDQHITVNTFMQGVWSILLHKYLQSDLITYGVIVSGRPESMKNVERKVGLFINTLVFKSEIEKDLESVEWLKKLQMEQVESRKYQYTPLSHVKEITGQKNDLFDTLMVFENYPVSDVVKAKKWSLRISNLKKSEHTNYPLTIVIGSSDVINLNFSFNSLLLTQRQTEKISDHFINVVHELLDKPSAGVHQLQIMNAEELKLLNSFNNTKTTYPKDKTIVELFEQQVKKTPNQTALIYEQKRMSYEELNERSNRLAHYLIKQGVTKDTLVPLCMERGMEMIVAILGILKSGGAYVPIDPQYPQQRIDYMLKDTGSNTFLVNTDTINRLKLKGAIAIDKLDLSKQSSENPKQRSAPDSAAYVIYTSGSTGQPKGVVVEHRNVVSLATGGGFTSFKTTDTLLSTGAPTFDASTIEYWGMLLNGGKLVLSREENLLNHARLKSDILEHWVTKMWFTSSWFNQLVDTDLELFKPLKTIMVGGERLSPPHISKLRKKYPEIELINGYGPTENTTFSLTHHITATDFETDIPIGKVLANREAYILDNLQQLLPVGVPGEIYLGGAGLSRGYLNNPELTKEKFITHPFSEDPEARLYKTGDLGRWTEEGEIEYLGRLDDQVKIRGYRIELGEIESALEKTGRITASVVLSRKDQTGTNRLVGYVVKKKGSTKENIQKALEKLLPEYMIPQWWVELESIPLTPNGKVDKKALPEVDAEGQRSGSYVAPHNQTQQKLVEIWQGLLGVEKVGIEDNFFELGGHSILAMRLRSEIFRNLNLDVQIKDLFQYNTISELDAFLKSIDENNKRPKIIKLDPEPERVRLSYSQERLWFIHQFEGSLQYHIPIILNVEGKLNLKALEFALKEIINRHKVLRTVFYDESGIGYQKSIPAQGFSIDQVIGQEHYSEVSNEDLIRAFIRRPFDLSSDFMLRVLALTPNKETSTVVFVMHHIASDAWSGSILVKEVMELFHSKTEKRPCHLPELKVQYSDYSFWQRTYLDEKNLQEKLNYWKSKLTDAAILNLSYDYPRPAIQKHNGSKTRLTIGKGLKEKLDQLNRKHGTTLYMSLLSALDVLLYNYSGQSDISIGASIANRPQKELEDLIGFFVNTITFRTEFIPEISFADLLDKNREITTDAYQNQEVPFEKVVETVVKERDPSRSPLFQVMLVLINTPETEKFTLGNLKFRKE